jgi:hypothetical protein
MMILHLFIIITGAPWNMTYIHASSRIIPVRLYPVNIPYLAHSSPFILLFLPFNSPPIIPYLWFRAERDFQKPSSQVL